MTHSNFGPNKSELFFRLGFSLVGLSMLLGGIAMRGMPKGPAMFEAFGIAGLFFGGTLLWSIWRLRTGHFSDAPDAPKVPNQE